MDSEIPDDVATPDEPEQPTRPGPGRVAPRKWADALRPRTTDQLQFVATTVFDGLAIAYEQTLMSVGIKPAERAKLLVKIGTALSNAVPKRRLWEAEQVVKGEAAQMSQGPSPKMEPRNVDVGDQSSEHSTPSGPSPRRGRPRAR